MGSGACHQTYNVSFRAALVYDTKHTDLCVELVPSGLCQTLYDLGHSNNCMGNVTTASRMQPNIIIVYETSESGVNIPASIPADIGGTKKAHVFSLPRHAFDTSFMK